MKIINLKCRFYEASSRSVRLPPRQWVYYSFYLELNSVGIFFFFFKTLCNCCCYLIACAWLGWLLPTLLSRMKVESQPLISMLESLIAAGWKSLESGRRYLFFSILNFHTLLLSVSGYVWRISNANSWFLLFFGAKLKNAFIFVILLLRIEV